MWQFGSQQKLVCACMRACVRVLWTRTNMCHIVTHLPTSPEAGTACIRMRCITTIDSMNIANIEVTFIYVSVSVSVMCASAYPDVIDVCRCVRAYMCQQTTLLQYFIMSVIKAIFFVVCLCSLCPACVSHCVSAQACALT